MKPSIQSDFSPLGLPAAAHPGSCPCLAARLERAEAALKVATGLLDERTAERDEALEDLRVAYEIGDTFWAALKPLDLPAINVGNPGEHVTDLIRERDEAHRRESEMRHVYDTLNLTLRKAGLNDLAVIVETTKERDAAHEELQQAEQNWLRQSQDLSAALAVNATIRDEHERLHARLEALLAARDDDLETAYYEGVSVGLDASHADEYRQERDDAWAAGKELEAENERLREAIAEAIANCSGCGGDDPDSIDCSGCRILRTALPGWKEWIEAERAVPEQPPHVHKWVEVISIYADYYRGVEVWLCGGCSERQERALPKPSEGAHEQPAEAKHCAHQFFPDDSGSTMTCNICGRVEELPRLVVKPPPSPWPLSEQGLSWLADALYLVRRDASEHPWKRVAEAAEAFFAARPSPAAGDVVGRVASYLENIPSADYQAARSAIHERSAWEDEGVPVEKIYAAAIRKRFGVAPGERKP